LNHFLVVPVSHIQGTRPGKLPHNYGKSPFSMGKSTILNGYQFFA
jgi:hypothetical protein